MEDQYGLPGELRHHHHHHHHNLSALAHRNINPSSASSPPNPNAAFHHHHHPFSLATPFPLVSGGALVDHSHFSLYHHHHNHHDHLESGGGGVQLWNNNNSGNNINNSTNVVGNIENNNVDGLMIGGEASNSNNNSRWPRQETLTLLEIRSRLNSKFKDTNQKAPLWDEISRIMAEEHGYQRSGKKCKEKFENLYKYYKKTKEGKAGRQDGKHYRFFRQLESIYGDTTQTQSSSLLLDAQYVGNRNNNSPSLLYDHQSNSNRPASIMNHDSLSFSINSTEFETSSSENNDEDLSAIAFKMNSSHQNKMKGVMMMSSGGRKSSTTSSTWKEKVEGFVDSQMKKIMATQETWMEKMLKSVIEKEEDRLAKEDHWRRQEAARFDQEFTEFWAKEKAWIESRDEALVVAVRNLRGKQSSSSTSTLELPSFPERITNNMGRDNSYTTTTSTRSYQRWSEEEISSLIELRTMFEYNNNNNVRESVWDEIASKMACLGFGRTANECREKWESVSLYVTMTSESKKKRREDYYKVIAPQPQQQQGYYYNFCDGSQQQQALELKQEGNSVMGLQLMDNNNEGLDNSNNNNPSSSSTNVGASSQIHPNNNNNFLHLLFGEGENLWEKYETLKLGKDKVNQF